MRHDIRAYFIEIASGLNLGTGAGDYTDEEIKALVSSLDTFHCMGNCVPYLISLSKSRFLFVGDNATSVLGMSQTEIMNMTVADFIGRVFRDEQGFIAASGPYRKSLETLMVKYRGRCDILLNVELSFHHPVLKTRRRLLLQRRPLKWDEDLGLELLGGLIQDITRLKPEGKPSACLTCNGELLETFETEDDMAPMLVGFSKREIDVLRLSDQGKSIDEVAELTGLSKATVYSHRRNIIAKSELPNIQKVIEVLKVKGVL